MSALIDPLFTANAKSRVAAAVKELETVTSAEVVVAVAPTSSRYAAVPLLGGIVCAAAMLLLVLFHPAEVLVAAIPIDVALAFAFGYVLVGRLDPVRRLVCGRKQLAEETRRAARASFIERRIGHTRRRKAVFVYVSVFERRVEVVCDAAVESAVSASASAWEDAVARLVAAVAGGVDLEAFVGALRGLAPILRDALPRAHDDENELPDEPVAG